MSDMKAFSISCALLVSCSASLQADEHLYCNSPDGKFALCETFTDLQPSHGDAAIACFCARRSPFNLPLLRRRIDPRGRDIAKKLKPTLLFLRRGKG
jgi:hypothetical protein